jgi:hypothetical protein
MYSEEDDALTGLGDPKIGGVHHFRPDAVKSVNGEILKNLLSHAHLLETGHILHYECTRFELRQSANELPVQHVSRVVDQPCVVPDLRKGLTRRTAYQDVDVASSCSCKAPSHSGLSDITVDGRGFRKVQGEGCTGVRVRVGSDNDRTAGLAEALSKPTGAAEEVGDAKLCGRQRRIP